MAARTVYDRLAAADELAGPGAGPTMADVLASSSATRRPRASDRIVDPRDFLPASEADTPLVCPVCRGGHVERVDGLLTCLEPNCATREER